MKEQGVPEVRPPLAVINSERFTLWNEHFQKLKDITESWNVRAKSNNENEQGVGREENGATLMTIGECPLVSRTQGPVRLSTMLTFVSAVQSQHEDFSDFPLLYPFKQRRSVALHGTIRALSLAFLQDRLSAELAKEPRKDKEAMDVHGKGGKQKLVGEFGEVLVHA
jgi:platelet-activating factor acetylhydrolase